MIELEGIKKDNLLNPISLSITAGQRIIITGKNGTGKTTFIRMIAGVCIPDSGKMVLNQESFQFPLPLLQYKRFFRAIQKNIFFAEGQKLLYENFTIEQNLKYYIELDSYNIEELESIYEKLEINEPMQKYVKELSLGTKQKLIALLVILSKKKFLILDEPTLGMDNDIKQIFMELLTKMNKTLLISTHERQIFSMFDTRYEFNNQNIIKVGDNIE